MAITVEKVVTRKQTREFIRFPYTLYKNDTNWVPPLLMDDYRKINRAKNPFYQHAEAEFFLARKDGKAVGRIAAIHDSIWEKTHHEKAAYWGWFECVEDPAVAKALFDAAFAWARARGCLRIIGPMSPNANDYIGCQVDGFEGSPVLLMEAKGGFALRTLNMKELKKEIERFNELYNQFEQVNAVFTPMTHAELELMANDLKIAVDPELIFFADVDGKPVGVSLTLPDFNVGFKAAHGRLLPFGIFHLLTAKKRTKMVRTISMGVLKDYRNRGIDLAFYYHTYKNGVRHGYRAGEMSWVEEDNVNMTNTAVKIGGKPYRKYRVYEYKL